MQAIRRSGLSFASPITRSCWNRRVATTQRRLSSVANADFVPNFEVIRSQQQAKMPKKDVKTAILLHGMMASGRNWYRFSRKLSQAFPRWQFLLVDIRNHGDSTLPARGIAKPPHSLTACAQDLDNVMKAFNEQEQFEHKIDALSGHSFGGKVALEYTRIADSPPPQVWVLDTYPTKLDEGSQIPGSFQEHTVSQIISILKTIEFPENARVSWLEQKLLSLGLSKTTAAWMTTNARYDDASNKLVWRFNLDAMQEMYESYKNSCMWELLESPPAGTTINYVRAANSSRWTPDILERFAQIQHDHTRLLTLENSGHWVHVDNPEGLFAMMESTFGG